MSYNINNFVISVLVIASINTIPVKIQEFNTSSMPSEERSTDVYSLTITTDPTEDGDSTHLNMSKYEEGN